MDHDRQVPEGACFIYDIFFDISIMNKEIDFREVLRRWAIGEVGSKEFGFAGFEECRNRLKSNQFTDTDLEVYLCRRQFPIMTIAQLNAKWLLKPISYVMQKFSEIIVIKDEGWKEKTNGSHLLIDAVKRSIDNPDKNSREYQILENIDKLDIDDFTGITFIYYKKAKRFITAEGHSRLMALYNYLVVEQKKLDIDIEMAVGITDNKWIFDPLLN